MGADATFSGPTWKSAELQPHSVNGLWNLRFVQGAQSRNQDRARSEVALSLLLIAIPSVTNGITHVISCRATRMAQIQPRVDSEVPRATPPTNPHKL